MGVPPPRAQTPCKIVCLFVHAEFACHHNSEHLTGLCMKARLKISCQHTYQKHLGICWHSRESTGRPSEIGRCERQLHHLVCLYELFSDSICFEIWKSCNTHCSGQSEQDCKLNLTLRGLTRHKQHDWRNDQLHVCLTFLLGP